MLKTICPASTANSDWNRKKKKEKKRTEKKKKDSICLNSNMSVV